MIILFYALLVLPFYFLHSDPEFPVFSLVALGSGKVLGAISYRSIKFQDNLCNILGFPK